MRKLLLGAIFMALTSLVPTPSMAQVNISIGFSLPPPIVFQAPPEVIVIPDTNFVYAAPGINVDLFFWDGWWWRLWEGRWYRSQYYDRGWGYYNNVPIFYYDVDPRWRRHYRDRNWYGHRWNYQPIPYRQLQQNWRSWNTNRYWERNRTWGVQNYKPRPVQQRQELRVQRQRQYQQRPEVRRYQQQLQQRQIQQQRQTPQQRQIQQQRQTPQQKQIQQQRQPRQPNKAVQPQSQSQQNKERSERQGNQGQPERRDAEGRR